MNQLVQPDLTVVGYPDYCLAYVQTVFKVPPADPHQPDAWMAWEACQFKHTDLPPGDVSVPVWFSWSGTVNGVYDDYGHVAISTPNGVYTNPLSGSGHKVFGSVADLESAYGVKYVGWSEDIETLRVVEGESMTPATPDMIKNLYGAFQGRQPSQGEIDSWNGRDVALLISALESAPDTTAYYVKVQNALKNAGANAIVLKPGTLYKTP